jgi:hypothetical protein
MKLIRINNYKAKVVPAPERSKVVKFKNRGLGRYKLSDVLNIEVEKI